MIFFSISSRWLLLLLVCVVADISAQNGLSRITQRMMGSVAVSTLDSMYNQFNRCPTWFPILVDRTQLQIGVVNRYGLGALTETFLQWQRPLGTSSLQIAVLSVGDVQYRTSGFQLGMNKSLGRDWRIGMDLGFSQVRVAGYGSRWSPGISCALAGSLDAKTTLGFRWENPQTWIGSKSMFSYALPRIRFGLARNLSDRLDFMGWMDWEQATVPGVFLQAHYRPSANWMIDLGWGRSPDQIVLGVQRVFFKGILRTSYSQDPVLGASCLISYRYSWPQKR